MIPLPLVALVIPAVLCACGSPERRIRRNQALFDTFPPAVQEEVRAGKVSPGFTKDMVRIAMGQPDYRFTRTTERMSQEVWVYARGRPGFGVSLGAVSGGFPTVYGGGLAADSHGVDERARVVFEEGKVAAVETRKD